MFGQLLLIAGSEAVWPTTEAWLVALLLAVLHSQRNLVGDVRDIRTDRFELPARFGA